MADRFNVAVIRAAATAQHGKVWQHPPQGRVLAAEGHRIAEEAHHELLHGIPKLGRATIHTNPCNHDGLDHHLLTGHHFSGS